MRTNTIKISVLLILWFSKFSFPCSIKKKIFIIQANNAQYIYITFPLLQICLLGLSKAFIVGGNSCMSPPVAMGFQNERYNGLWYEVAKAQTSGGAFFEKDCVCTTIDIQPVSSSNNGDSTAINSCRKLAPSGDFMNATGGWVCIRINLVRW